MGKPLGSSFSSPLQGYCRPTGSLGCGPLVPQVVVGMITLLVGGSGLLGNHSTGVTECHCSSHGRLGCVTVTNIPKPMAPVWASDPAKVALHDLQAEVLLTRSGLRKMVQPEEDGERTSSPSPGIPGTERRCRCAWLMGRGGRGHSRRRVQSSRPQGPLVSCLFLRLRFYHRSSAPGLVKLCSGGLLQKQQSDVC